MSELAERSTDAAVETPARFRRVFSWMVIVGLLILRVGLLGWYPEVTNKQAEWIEPVYQIGTYALTAIFLYGNRQRLAGYHFDKLAVFFFILFKPLQTLILPVLGGGNTEPVWMAFPHITALAVWAIAVMLLIALRSTIKRLPKIQAVNWGWLGIGCLSGSLMAFVLGLMLIPWSNIQPVMPMYDITMLLAFPYQIGYAGVDEEPLFRGLLWGQLRKAGWRTGLILIFQAAVFMAAHARLLTDSANIPFAAAIFLGGMVFGMLALKSRSTATSMAAHGFYNASAIFAYYLLSDLFA